jgi:hypothetical protein
MRGKALHAIFAAHLLFPFAAAKKAVYVRNPLRKSFVHCSHKQPF